MRLNRRFRVCVFRTALFCVNGLQDAVAQNAGRRDRQQEQLHLFCCHVALLSENAIGGTENASGASIVRNQLPEVFSKLS